MSTTGTAAEQAGQPHRPLTPAEQLAAIFAGEMTADGGEIAALAKSVLEERDRLQATLTVIRMIATEATTDDADLLRQTILDQLGPADTKAGA